MQQGIASEHSATARHIAADPVLEGPVELNAPGRGAQLLAWAREQREMVDATLGSHGAVLIRGTRLNGSEQFDQFVATLFGAELLRYRNPSTPRTQVRGNVYTSTEYPPEEIIPLHNENSYTNEWAMRIAFFCQLPATEGGETPIADSRRVYASVSPAVRQRFEQAGVCYLRNYGAVDLPWQHVFETEDPREVERQCLARGVDFQWSSGGGLRTWETRAAVAAHPATRERVWFNQAHLFHISNLRAEVRQSLIETFGEDGVPRTCLYGDRTPIPESDLDEIRSAYDRHKVIFPWSLGDVLLLDNMLWAHGREPYRGARRVLVGMAHPMSACGADGR